MNNGTKLPLEHPSNEILRIFGARFMFFAFVAFFNYLLIDIILPVESSPVLSFSIYASICVSFIVISFFHYAKSTSRKRENKGNVPERTAENISDKSTVNYIVPGGKGRNYVLVGTVSPGEIGYNQSPETRPTFYTQVLLDNYNVNLTEQMREVSSRYSPLTKNNIFPSPLPLDQSLFDAITHHIHSDNQNEYSIVISPNYSGQELSNKIAIELKKIVPEICHAYGWQLKKIDVQPEYLALEIQTTEFVSMEKIVNIIQELTTIRLLRAFEDLAIQYKPGDFWSRRAIKISNEIDFSDSAHIIELIKTMQEHEQEREKKSGKTFEEQKKNFPRAF